MKQIRTHFSILLLAILITSISSCREKNTEDPNEAYELWGGEVPKGVEVIHGKYWQSSHWSKEYIMYLELKASRLWRNEFIKQNNLVENKEPKSIPSDAPNWFKPGKNYRSLTLPGFSQGSIYYEDTITGQMFIYEIQL
jgi:hypothetical protein